MYTVFTRNWWKKNPSWPNGLEPHMGRKNNLAHVETEQEARKMCDEWNKKNSAGKYGRKAEYSRYE